MKSDERGMEASKVERLMNWEKVTLMSRTGGCHLELGVVLYEVLKLDLVFGSKVIHLFDVFLLTIVFVTAKPVAGDEHHANPGQTRRTVELQDVNGVRDVPGAGVLNQAGWFEESDLSRWEIGWSSWDTGFRADIIARRSATFVAASAAEATVGSSWVSSG